MPEYMNSAELFCKQEDAFISTIILQKKVQKFKSGQEESNYIPHLGKCIYIHLGLLNDAFNCQKYTVLNYRSISEILRLWNQSDVHVHCISLIGTL
jgi:hypothetical protein